MTRSGGSASGGARVGGAAVGVEVPPRGEPLAAAQHRLLKLPVVSPAVRVDARLQDLLPAVLARDVGPGSLGWGSRGADRRPLSCGRSCRVGTQDGREVRKEVLQAVERRRVGRGDQAPSEHVGQEGKGWQDGGRRSKR